MLCTRIPLARTLLCSACLLVLVLFNAQRATAQADSVGYIPRHNLVKLGLTSGLFSIISVNYERVLNPKLSVALTMSYMLPVVPSPFFDLDTDELEIASDRRISGHYLTPEVKWFLEKSDERPAPRGLYVGGYLRYSDTRYTGSVTATASGTDANGTVNGNLRIDLYEYGIGPSVGYQWLAIHDRLVFDAVFFAPRFSLYRLAVKADLNGDGELFADLGQALEEKLGREVAPIDIDLSTSGSTTVDRSSLGYRFGIKIGYAF
jgi:hypothetical protein